MKMQHFALAIFVLTPLASLLATLNQQESWKGWEAILILLPGLDLFILLKL